MRTRTFSAATIVLTLALAAASIGSRAYGDLVIINDTFTGTQAANLNPASYPNPTTIAAYDVASTKNQSPAASYASGKLTFGMAATTSGFDEVQARFANTPVTLTNVNDFVRLTVVFRNGNNLLAGGTSSLIAAGLYNSGGGNNPTPLGSSGLNATTGSAIATTNIALWQGYAGQVALTGGSNRIFTRPIQTAAAGTTTANQDLLGNGAGGGLFSNPAGTTLSGNTTSTTAALTNGSQYTLTMLFTLTGSGLQIDQNLYDGVGTGGTNLSTISRTATGGNILTQSFDGLAIGFRNSGTSLATQMEINSILVESNDVVAVPEASALLMTSAWSLTAVGIALVSRRRRRSN